MPTPDGILRIHKYPNRRLYDRTGSRHLTHEELFELVVAGRRVEVVESKTGVDVTNAVLAQVLLERDPGRLAAFPTELFHLLIRVNERLVPTLQQSLLQAVAQAMHGWNAWQERVSAMMPVGADPRSVGAGIAGANPLDWMLAAMRAGAPPAPDRSFDTDSGAADALASLRAEVALLRREVAARGDERPKRRRAAAGKRKG